MLHKEPFFARMLQADGAGGGGGEPPAPGDDPGQGGTEAQDQDAAKAPRTFSQAEVDAILAQRLAREKKNAGGVQQPATSKALDELGEVERLASMTPEDRAAYVQRRQQERQAEEMARREADLTRREVRAEVLTTLGELGLPREIADAIDLSSQEASAQTLRTLAPALMAWADQRAEARVLELTKGQAPPAGSADVVQEIDFDAAFGIPRK